MDIKTGLLVPDLQLQLSNDPRIEWMRRQVYFESATLAIDELAQAPEITQDITMVTDDLNLPDNTIRRLLCTQSMERFHVHTRRLLPRGNSRIRDILGRRWRI